MWVMLTEPWRIPTRAATMAATLPEVAPAPSGLPSTAVDGRVVIPGTAPGNQLIRIREFDMSTAHATDQLHVEDIDDEPTGDPAANDEELVVEELLVEEVSIDGMCGVY